MVKAWKQLWKDHKDVEISQGDIFGEDAPITDAIVSPANSFGFMDGGIDAVYSQRWPHLQGKLQKHLLENYFGELPVGNATIIPVAADDVIKPGNKEDFNYLISAPTMRIPHDIRGTVNAYLAFRATIIEVLKFNEGLTENLHIKTILCPGLGTAIGMMPHPIAAMQMYFAWKYMLVQPLELGDDLGAAWNSHQLLRRGVF